MRFYRPATEEDFQKEFQVNISPSVKTLPTEVEKLIKDGLPLQGAVLLQQTIGLGFRECKEYCTQFEAFLKAKSDFYAGKSVYTDY